MGGCAWDPNLRNEFLHRGKRDAERNLWVGAHGIEPWTSFLSGTRSTTEPRTPTLAVFYHSFYEWPRSSYHFFEKWPSRERRAFFGKISLTKIPVCLRMFTMREFTHDVEADRLEDGLEREFRDLEGKLVEKIKLTYKENLKEFPAGVSVEIASDEEKDFRLYIDSNGSWTFKFQTSGFEIGKKPNFSNLLNNLVFVIDKDYRGFDREIREKYLYANRGILTRDLVGRMQKALDRVGLNPS